MGARQGRGTPLEGWVADSPAFFVLFSVCVCVWGVEWLLEIHFSTYCTRCTAIQSEAPDEAAREGGGRERSKRGTGTRTGPVAGLCKHPALNGFGLLLLSLLLCDGPSTEMCLFTWPYVRAQECVPASMCVCARNQNIFACPTSHGNKYANSILKSTTKHTHPS